MGLQDGGGINAMDIAKVASARGTISIDISGEVKSAMTDFISTCNRMVSGSKLGKYFSDTETLVNRLATAVTACQKNFTQFNAGEVVNTYNALVARAGDADLSKMFSGFEGGFNRILGVVSQAQGQVGKFLEGFSSADFSKMFSSYDSIKQWAETLGLSSKEVDNLMAQLSSLAGTDVSGLNKQLAEARATISALNNEVETLKSGSGFTALQEQVDDLKWKLESAEDELTYLRDRAKTEFSNFLSANEINPEQTDIFGNLRFQEFFDKIENGTMTAREAIMKFKSDYSNLFSGQNYDMGLFSASQVDSFITKLEAIYVRVEEIGAYIRSISGEAPGLIANAVEKDIAAMQKEEDEISRIAKQGGELGSAAQAIASLGSESATGAAKIGELSAGTTTLIEKLGELGGVGAESLSSIASIFRNIGNIQNLQVSTEEFDKLKIALEGLQNISGIEKIQQLSNINLQGLSGLKISKASMSNLLTYLPEISNSVDVGKLQALSTVDLHGLSDLKVGVASVRNIAELLSALNQFSGGQNAGKISFGQIDESIAEKAQRVTQAVKEEKQALQDVDSSAPSHKSSMRDAAEAEREKASASKELTTSLNAEEAATNSVTDAQSKHSKVLAQQASMGKFTAWVNEFQAKIKALNYETPELTKHIEDLRKFANGIEGATTDQARTQNYEQFSVILDVVRVKLAAEAAEERNASAAARELLNQLNAFSAATAKLDSGAYANQLKTFEERIKSLSSTTPDIERNLAGLRQAFADMQSAAASGDMDKMAAAQEQWKSSSTGLTAAINAQAAAERNLAAAEREAAAAEKEKSAGVAARQSGLKDLNNMLVQAVNAEKKYALAGQLPSMKGNYANLKQTIGQIRELITVFEQAGSASDEMKQKVADLKVKLSGIMTGFKTGNFFTNYFSNGMQMLMSRLSYTFGLANLVYRSVAGVKKMVSTAVELDTAMNNLQIVTRGTNEEMAAYTDRVTAMAMETAQSTKDLIDATTVYARLGYDMDESAVLAKYTAMLQGVGDIEAQAAQDAITAIVKAFDVKVSDVESIMDKLVTVGNNFPISVSQIAEGMNNASSMLAVAGNSFEESVALLTAANTTIQNVSKASTGLRTIAARIRKTTTGLDDEGEIVEESKYQDMIDALSKHKVSLVDINGEYRKTYDIIKDISHVWDQMTSMEQAAVIEAMAGTRQQNIFTSLVTQFKEAENAMAAMSDSAGALEESYDIRMSSIQAHVNQLKVAFDQLSMDVVQSDFAKGLVDALTKIVLAIDKVVEKAGVLGTVLGTIAAVELLRNLPAIGALILGLIAPMVTFGEAAAVAGANLVGLTGAIAGVAPALGPIALAAAAIGAAFLIFNAIAKESSNSIESLRDEATKAERSVNDLSSKIDLNNQRIKELNDLKTDGSISDAQARELATLEQENQKLAEQLELRKQIAKYTAGVLAEAEEEENRARAQRFFDTGRTEDVYLDRGNNGRYVTQRTTTGFGGILNAIDDFNEAEQNLIEANNELSNALADAEKEGVELPKTEYDRLTADVKSAQERLAAETNILRELRIDLMEEADATGLTPGQRAGYQAMIGKIGRALGETETSYDRMMLRDLSESQIDAIRNIKDFDEFDDLFQSDKELEVHVRAVVDENELKSITEEESFYFHIDRDALAREMQSLTEGGNTDLLMRPVIHTDVLKEKGFAKEVKQAGEGAATLFSQSFSNKAGDTALFTPMYLDENGNTQVLTSEEFGKYCSEVMEGVREDDLKLKITADFTGDNAEAEAKALALRLSDLQGIYYQAEIEALNKSGTAAQKAASEHEFLSKTIEGIQKSIKSLETYTSEAMSESGLSFEGVTGLTHMFDGIEGFDAEEFFDITSTGIRVNSEELGKLTQKYYELERKKISDKIRNLRDEADQLRQEMSELTDAEEDTARAQELIAQSDALEKEISEAEMAAAAIDGMTNAYMNYLRALNTPNQNENYLNIANGFKTIGDMIKAGWVGNDEVTAFLDYIYADRTGVLKDNETAWKNLFKTIGKSKYSIKDFYTPDSSQGVYNFLDTIDSIFPEYVTKHKNGRYSFNFNGDRLFEIQDELNLSVEAMQDIERALESAGFHVDFNTLTDDVARASYELKKMGKIKFSINDVLTGGADVDEAIDSVLTRIKNKFQDPETGQIDFSIKGAQEAYDILMRLLEIKDQLNGKDASVDVETNADSANKDLDDLRKKIEDLDNLNKQIDVETALGNDPKDLEDQVQEILTDIGDNKVAQELEVDTTSGKSAVESFDKAVENKEVTQTLTVEPEDAGDNASVEVDAEVKPDAKSAQMVEDTIPKEITTIWHIEPDPSKSDEARAAAEEPLTATLTILGELDPSVDSAKADASVPPSDATVTIVPDPNPYDTEIVRVLATEAKTVRINLDASAYYSAIGAILSVASKTVVITTHLFTIDHGTTGGGGSSGGGGGANVSSTTARLAQGTAHAGGTAMARGYWGAKKTEKALVGEIGPELRIRDGQWEMLGEDSAEIADIRKGDIIFNAEQTRQILKNGKIKNGKKRGITYLGGTAYDSGSGPGRPARKPTSVTSGTSHKGTDTTKKGDSDKTDWIEIWISRFEYAIERLASVAEDTMKRLSTRLSSIANEISETEQELKLSYDMYERYMYEAHNVGLDESLARLVRGGAIDISFYGEETRSKIQEYQTWYEKALDVASNIEEMHRQIGQLYISSFEYVQKNFEDQINEIEHKTTMAQKNLDMARKKGYLDNASFFETMAGIQEQEIAKLNVELQDLNYYFKQAMNSHEIDEGSEAWYEMRAAIHDVEEAIADANIQLVDYQKTIRSIQWDYFDYAQERLQQISQEANFLVDVMSNDILFQDDGKFTELGEATAAMRAVNFNQFMLQADEYNKERLKIEKQLADDPFDKELIERRESLLELQQQSIMAAENEKDAVADLVEQGINKELEALQNLIDTYKDSLDSAKDLYEYQKKVTEKTADIASIQKQLSAYTNDTSEETRAKVQKLQKDLQDARDDLSETERDHSIEEQKRVLEELYDEYESFMNARLDDVDLLMEDIIAGTNENMDRINTTIQEVGAEVGYTVTEAMLGVLRGDLSNYDHQFEDLSSVAVTLDNIYSMVAAMARASGAVKAYATGGLVDYTGMAAVHGTKGRPELMLNASDTANFLAAAKLLRDVQATSSIPSTDVARGFGSGSGGMNIGQISMAIQIDHVQDYNDLVTQMRNDPKFERLINAMTLDRAVGKSSFSKNKIVF